MLLGARSPAKAVAFEGLFRAMAPAIRRYATRQVGADLADDIVDDTFSVVWRRWSDLPEEAHLRRAWVYRVAHNAVSHAIRTRTRRQSLVTRVQQTERAPHPADRVVGDDRVSRLLANLPAREREAMSLVVWDGLSASQAAFVLGCSTTAISSRDRKSVV